MTVMQRSSSSRRGVQWLMASRCDRCDLAPCACEYARSLLPGGRNEQFADEARRNVMLPHPHRSDGHRSCPCVECWARRMQSWDNVIPLRVVGSGVRHEQEARP